MNIRCKASFVAGYRQVEDLGEKILESKKICDKAVYDPAQRSFFKPVYMFILGKNEKALD
jgi:hypothetical protein